MEDGNDLNVWMTSGVCRKCPGLQDGRDGGVTAPQAGRFKGLEGGVGDGGESQWPPGHPRDVVEAARLLITCGCRTCRVRDQSGEGGAFTAGSSNGGIVTGWMFMSVQMQTENQVIFRDGMS